MKHRPRGNHQPVRETPLGHRCTQCGGFTLTPEYGMCSKCLYVPHRHTSHMGDSFVVTKDPEGIFRKGAAFGRNEFYQTAADGSWPDGLEFTWRGKRGKVVNGDDGKGRIVWVEN